MIGLDTNVLVRYLTQDDPKQSPVATRLVERTLSPDNPGFIASIVLCEIAWVLADCYGAERKQIKSAIEGLLASKQMLVEDAEIAWKAVRAWDASQSDFSDALIAQVALARGASRTVTFDKQASRLPGFELLA